MNAVTACSSAPHGRPARYGEIRGRLEPGPATAAREQAPAAAVILSSLSQGSALSPPWEGISVRYVARGLEVYRIAGRTYPLRAGELMLAPQTLGAEIEIPRRGRGETLGLCLFFPGAPLAEDDCDALAMPMVASASCSSLGGLLAKQVAHLAAAPRQPVDARRLLQGARPHVVELAREIDRQVRAVDGAREATRYDAVRRAHVARAHLHATLHRAVSLAELAGVANLSAYQLARTFRDCFGDSPARYHRELRLHAVREEVTRTGTTWQQACERFGFAGGSSFAHAWRRAFGDSPRAALEAASVKAAGGAVELGERETAS